MTEIIIQPENIKLDPSLMLSNSFNISNLEKLIEDRLKELEEQRKLESK